MIVDLTLRIALAVIILAIEVLLLFIACGVAVAIVAGLLYFAFSYPERAEVIGAWAVVAGSIAYGLHWNWNAKRVSAAAKKIAFRERKTRSVIGE